MSRVASKALRGRVAYGAARRTVAYHCSTCRVSIEAAATVCWASTSSGLRGGSTASICPASMRWMATVASMRSRRVRGYTSPVDVPPTWWLARPMRCSALATEGGAATWITRSTSPMSMPSSRLEVATTQRRLPSFSDCSISRRCSLDTDPWCERAISAGLSSTRDTVLPVNEP